jgi:hypothetical protein
MQGLDHWQSLVREAPSEQEVVRAVREYLELWPEAERAAFPCKVNPWAVRSRQHIAECAVDLTRAELDFQGDGAAREKLADMTAIFRDAVTRFSQLSQDARLLGPQSED